MGDVLPRQGIVKWFNTEKKYGFILMPEGLEVFVHFSDIMLDGYKTLKPGDFVRFNIVNRDKGPRAVDVQKVRKVKKTAGPLNDGTSNEERKMP